MATHSSILAWKSHGQMSLLGCSPWGCKESDMTEATVHTHNHFNGDNQETDVGKHKKQISQPLNIKRRKVYLFFPKVQHDFHVKSMLIT